MHWCAELVAGLESQPVRYKTLSPGSQRSIYAIILPEFSPRVQPSLCRKLGPVVSYGTVVSNWLQAYSAVDGEPRQIDCLHRVIFLSFMDSMCWGLIPACRIVRIAIVKMCRTGAVE